MRYAKFTKPLSVAVAPQVYEKILNLSVASHTSVGEIVRGILNEYLERECNNEQPGMNPAPLFKEDSQTTNLETLFKE